MVYELWRRADVCLSLMDVLEEMLGEGSITENLAVKLMEQFDESIFEALEKKVNAKAQIKADLEYYQNYDNVWQFKLKNVVFKLNPTGGSAVNAPEITCDVAKVVAADAKLAQR